MPYTDDDGEERLNYLEQFKGVNLTALYIVMVISKVPLVISLFYVN